MLRGQSGNLPDSHLPLCCLLLLLCRASLHTNAMSTAPHNEMVDDTSKGADDALVAKHGTIKEQKLGESPLAPVRDAALPLSA